MAARRRLEAGQLFIIPNLAADALQPLPVVVLRQAFARGLEPALPEHILANVAHFLLVGEHGTTAPSGALCARGKCSRAIGPGSSRVSFLELLLELSQPSVSEGVPDAEQAKYSLSGAPAAKRSTEVSRF